MWRERRSRELRIGERSEPARGLARGLRSPIRNSRLRRSRHIDYNNENESLLAGYISIGYMIACLTSGAISKQEVVVARLRTANSAALTTSLDNLIHKSLKDEQTECIRRIISLEEAVLPVLPTGFGKGVITGGQP